MLHLILLFSETLEVVKGLHLQYPLYGNHQYGDNVLDVAFYIHGSQGYLSLIPLVISSWTVCNACLPAEFPGMR